MPQTLQGSCRCGAVSFSVESHTPYPYQLCYCSVCRKVGGSGYAINLGADFRTLEVQGSEKIDVFVAQIDGAPGGCQRSYCRSCGTMLWVYDDRWPVLMHPFASCIDSELPEAPARTHIFLGSKPPWVQPDIRPGDQTFDDRPAQSIEDWHRTRNLWID